MGESNAALTQALRDVADRHGEGLRKALLGTFLTIAHEASRNEEFAASLAAVWGISDRAAAAAPQSRQGRQRSAPVLDPFEVYGAGGESLLRNSLSELDAGRLKDIIAAYAMDHDRKAMLWRRVDKLVDRIIEHVETRAAKGSSLR